MNPLRVLIVKLSSLGDVIQTFPVIADILHAHPTATIDWAVEEAFAPLVERVVGINRVIPIAHRRWRKMGYFSAQARTQRAAFKQSLQQETYDFVIDAQGLIKSALVARSARLAAGGRRGSFANKSDACGYEWPVKLLLEHNQPMPKRIHAVERTRLLASLLMGYASQGSPTVAFKALPESTPSKRIFFAHGTTRKDNEWAFEEWESLSRSLIAAGFEVVLPQANDAELAFCERMSAVTLPRLDLAQILDEMSQCCAVIGVDSGLSHLAVALNKPCVQIFQHDRAWRAGPIGAEHQVALSGGFNDLVIPSSAQVFGAFQTVMQYAPK